MIDFWANGEDVSLKTGSRWDVAITFFGVFVRNITAVRIDIFSID